MTAFDNINGKSYLVTGCSGFIATHLINHLLKGGATVYGVDVVDPKRDDITFLGDCMNNELKLEDATHNLKLDGIFHMAVVPMTQTNENPRAALTTNIMGTFNLLDLAKRMKCKLVFSSASSVYGNTDDVVSEGMPFNPAGFYGGSKAASECIIMSAANQGDWKVPAVSLRYMNVIGPKQSGGLIPFTIKKIMAGEQPTIQGDGSAEFDFVWVGDVVQANILAMQSTATGAFNVGGGEHATVITIVRKLLTLAGKSDVEPIFVPEPPGSVKRRVGSINLIEDELGYEPTVYLDEALQLIWEASLPVQTTASVS